MQESAFKEFHKVQAVFAQTQMDADEKKAINDEWWMPYHIGMEHWHSYDTTKAWFWGSAKKAKKAAPRLA